jgi:hypothetical protein
MPNFSRPIGKKLLERRANSLSVLVVALLFFSANVLAANTPAAQNPVGGGLFVGLGIAYLARRREIGGWLLYFYLQLYSSLLFTLLLLPAELANLAPSAWEETGQYAWYLLSTLPPQMSTIAEVVIATYILFNRSQSGVSLLKRALLSLVITSIASTGIDLIYFPDGVNLFFDGLTLFFASVWLTYFNRSSRVRMVFVERSWNYGAHEALRAPLTHLPKQGEP